MAITRKDEILEKAILSDASAVPRYNLRAPDGSLIGENVSLELANVIAQSGTPVNAAALNEMLAASGVTSGTATAFSLTQDGYYLFDGAPIRFKLHLAPEEGATININGTGAKKMCTPDGNNISANVLPLTWVHGTYSAALDAYVILPQRRGYQLLSKNELSSDGYSIFVQLPKGYARYRVTFDGLLSTKWSNAISFNVPRNFMSMYGIGINTNGPASVSTITSEVNKSTYHAVTMDEPEDVIANNVLVYEFLVSDNYTRLLGEVKHAHGWYKYFGTFGYKIESFTLDITATSRGGIAAGTKITVEGAYDD